MANFLKNPEYIPHIIPYKCDPLLQGHLRYMDYGVMRHNLHQIGRELLARTPA
jgi:hypothetical protein